MQNYFQYRWEKDKITPLRDSTDQQLFKELPFRVQNELFCSYLFNNFLTKYSNIFGMRQLQIRKRKKFLRMFSLDKFNLNIDFFDPEKIVQDDKF